eukprot:466912-Prymnesium_polylepis.2
MRDADVMHLADLIHRRRDEQQRPRRRVAIIRVLERHVARQRVHVLEEVAESHAARGVAVAVTEDRVRTKVVLYRHLRLGRRLGEQERRGLGALVLGSLGRALRPQARGDRRLVRAGGHGRAQAVRRPARRGRRARGSQSGRCRSQHDVHGALPTRLV